MNQLQDKGFFFFCNSNEVQDQVCRIAARGMHGAAVVRARRKQLNKA